MQLREKLQQAVRVSAVAMEGAAAPGQQTAAKEAEVFLSQLTALSTPRNVRTRRLAQAQDNPEMTKTARLAQVFRSLYNAVAQAKGTLYQTCSQGGLNLESIVDEVYYCFVLLAKLYW